MEFNPYEVILLLLTTIGPLRVTIVCATLTCGAHRSSFGNSPHVPS